MTATVSILQAIGTPCARCGLAMLRYQALDVDWSNPVSKRAGNQPDRIAHRHCIRAARDWR